MDSELFTSSSSLRFCLPTAPGTAADRLPTNKPYS